MPPLAAAMPSLAAAMPSEVQAIFDAWSPPLAAPILLCAIGLLYIRGWLAIRRSRPAIFPQWRLWIFIAGLASIALAIASPLDSFADAMLSAHMVQHLLLMSVAPPLLLLGYPVVPLLRGMPRVVPRSMLGPALRMRWLRRFGHALTHPIVAWFAMNLVFLGWHVPAAYDFALRNEHWHEFEHVCFLAASTLFWWPVIQPWPTRPYNFGWRILFYLLSADIVNTALSAFLAFCNRPVYAFYLTQTNPLHLSPVSDQTLGAVIMWVLGSLVFLLPAVVITMSLLQPKTVLQPQTGPRN